MVAIHKGPSQLVAIVAAICQQGLRWAKRRQQGRRSGMVADPLPGRRCEHRREGGLPSETACVADLRCRRPRAVLISIRLWCARYTGEEPLFEQAGGGPIRLQVGGVDHDLFGISAASPSSPNPNGFPLCQPNVGTARLSS